MKRTIALVVSTALVASLLVLAVSTGLASPAAADTLHLVVDRTDDVLAASACTAAPNDCSLRGAVVSSDADGNAEIETITVPAGTYALTLVGTDIAGGSLDVAYSVNFEGSGSGSTIIDAGGVDRAFTFFRGIGPATDRIVSLSGMTLRHGSTCGSAYAASGTGGNRQGGAVFVNGIATFDDLVVEDSTACDKTGGGIGLLGGSLALSSSVVRRNIADNGGGLFSSGSLTVTDSTIDSNTGTGGGGGLSVAGAVTIDGSTISNNIAKARGGGIIAGDDTTSACCAATITLTNSTVTGNVAQDWVSGTPQYFPGVGAGIYVKRSSVTLLHTTITDNTSETQPVGPTTGIGAGIATG
ncbi:MAG: hypothetical protein V7636_833, partial [Actinomycetota bacterium]